MFDQEVYDQTWLDQRRARGREAATLERRRHQRLAFLVLALIGLPFLLWQLTLEDPNTWIVLAGMAAWVPFLSTLRRIQL